MTIEAMKQMVEALEIAAEGGGVDFYAYAKEGRQAIAEAEKQEPVAWKTDDIELYVREDKFGFYNIPLYTTPQQRTWVGLTDEEKESLINKKVDGAYLTVMETIELTEAKLRSKNHA
jgi:hypothetical protein